MKTKLLLLYLWVSFFHHGQTYRFKIIDPVICFDYNTHQIVAIEDSLYRIEIDLATKKSVKKPLHLDSQVTFQDFKSNFIPLSSEGSPIYYADRGCGWVLELRKDSIVRVDCSFHHQNQYEGAFFMHHGSPHIFGGYGLFTYKNFITKFNKELKQWYLESEGDRFTYRDYLIFQANESRLNVLLPKGKWTKNPNELWRYSFNTRKWNYLGKVEGLDSLAKKPPLVINDNIIVGCEYLYEFDFEKLRLNRYYLNPTNTVLRILKFPSFYGVLKQVLNRENEESVLSLIDHDLFTKNHRVSSTEIRLIKKDESAITRYWGILIVAVVVFAMIWLTFKLKRRGKRQVEISPNVEELLQLWLSKPDYLLELNELNDLVNYDNPSMDTLKKRRENLTRLFVVEISSMYQLPEHQIYEPLPHPLDKRMKLLKLSSKLVERIKKGN
ncbi:MAG: hypothetical protein EB023_08520 [Flavobacteriia bacterium]|nr:hypothetical protein [Flavobacteriia bacterium]